LTKFKVRYAGLQKDTSSVGQAIGVVRHCSLVGIKRGRADKTATAQIFAAAIAPPAGRQMGHCQQPSLVCPVMRKSTLIDSRTSMSVAVTRNTNKKVIYGKNKIKMTKCKL
jgi:hypothetical protein